MTLKELKQKFKKSGIVGAGGAGFPSYAKLDEKADTIILNCAECEPLLKLHRQVLAKYAFEIMQTLELVSDAVGAKDVIIAIKKGYKEAINAVKENLDSFKKIRIVYLPEVYPSGDEVVAIYETTKRVVAPGKLPITVGVTVFNVETVYNMYRALNDKNVTHKYVTVAGEVNNPVTVKAPVGTAFKKLIEAAGGAKIEDYVLICGGPMTGNIAEEYQTVTKTTNGILVMPKNHFIINKRRSSVKTDMKRAMSACCQCRMCTDLCPRNLLGHPIKPSEFMRAASSNDTKIKAPYMNTVFCSSCGLCEMYSCTQGLSPRMLISRYKAELKANKVQMPENPEFKSVSEKREARKVPTKRLIARLGLTKYDVSAPLTEEKIENEKVKIALSQHIGAPCVSCVKAGDTVKEGQIIGKADNDKLGADIHCSINGKVVDVNEKFITVKKD